MDIIICVNFEKGACAKPHISFDKLKTTVYKEWTRYVLGFHGQGLLHLLPNAAGQDGY